MTEFTYDLLSDDADVALIGAVRLELGDTKFGAGVKPDGSNFSDEELQYFVDQAEGDVNGAVGCACRSLAKQWTNVANVTVGPRKEELGKVAGEWATRAKELVPGFDASTYAVKVVSVDQSQDPYKYRPEDENSL